jgi:glycosyltransferase involved in cell wall biosynthesis
MKELTESSWFEADLSVVIPLMNEEESVVALLERLDEVLAPRHGAKTDKGVQPAGYSNPWLRLSESAEPILCEIILVDDGSTDRTCERAVEACSGMSVPTRVISLQRNFGQTAAMQAGIDAATGRLIATLDGDLQNDPADIPMMVDHLESEGLDLLCGRRKNRQDGMFLRLIPSWIANRLISRVTGVKISDYGCSLKVYRSSVIKQVRLMGEMHRFIPAWVALVTDPSRIGEIDVRHRAREFGRSKYGISRTLRVILDLMSVLFFMRFRARPGHFFGAVGLVIGLLGAAMLGSLVVAKYGMGQDIGTRPMLIVGSLAMLSSIQFICFGIMAELLSRTYYEASDRTTYVTRDIYSSRSMMADVAVFPKESASRRLAG